MEFYTGRHSLLNTTPSANYQNTASWNVHDLVLKIILLFFVVLFFFFFLHNMYSFLSHSQVVRDTSQISALLACPGIRLSGNATAGIIIIKSWRRWREKVSHCSKFTQISPHVTPVWFGGVKNTFSAVLLNVTGGHASSGEESGL